MALTDAERGRVRYHLGIPEVSLGPSMQLGMPASINTSFIVENAMDALLPRAEPRVRLFLQRLDDLEVKLFEAADYLVAEGVGDVRLRGAEPGRTHPDLLEREYKRWAKRLADLLAVRPYAYSNRFGGGGGLNVRVAHDF